MRKEKHYFYDNLCTFSTTFEVFRIMNLTFVSFNNYTKTFNQISVVVCIALQKFVQIQSETDVVDECLFLKTEIMKYNKH